MAADVADAIVQSAIKSNATERLSLEGSVTFGVRSDEGFNLRLRIFGGVSGGRSAPPAELYLEPLSRGPKVMPITVELTEESIPTVSMFIVGSFHNLPHGVSDFNLGKRDSNEVLKPLLHSEASQCL